MELLPHETEADHEAANQASWLMCGETGPVYLAPFAAYSDGSAAAGGLSPAWGQPDHPEINLRPAEMAKLPAEEQRAIRLERKRYSDERRLRFFAANGIIPNDVASLWLNRIRGIDIDVVDADSLERQEPYAFAENGASMIYTKDPNRVLVLDVGDCAGVVGYGKREDGEELLFILHVGWRDAEDDFVAQGLNFVRNKLEFDPARMHYVNGPSAFNMPYYRPNHPLDNDELFANPAWEKHLRAIEPASNHGGYNFQIDLQGFILDEMAKHNITRDHIFVDTSDTTRGDSGYSSHSRWANGRIDTPTRGLVVAMHPEYAAAAQKRADEYLRHTLGERVLASSMY